MPPLHTISFNSSTTATMLLHPHSFHCASNIQFPVSYPVCSCSALLSSDCLNPCTFRAHYTVNDQFSRTNKENFTAWIRAYPHCFQSFPSCLPCGSFSCPSAPTHFLHTLTMADLCKDPPLASQVDAIIASLPILSSLATTKSKNKSDLSFMSTIKCPQLWPNHYVTRLEASRPAYEDLDMAQFVRGYLDCIRQSPISTSLTSHVRPFVHSHWILPLVFSSPLYEHFMVTTYVLSNKAPFLGNQTFPFPSWSLSALPRTSFTCL